MKMILVAVMMSVALAAAHVSAQQKDAEKKAAKADKKGAKADDKALQAGKVGELGKKAPEKALVDPTKGHMPSGPPKPPHKP